MTRKLTCGISILLFHFLLAGCATAPDAEDTDNSTRSDVMPPTNNIHFHTEQLARQLFDTIQHLPSKAPVAVGTILPVELENGNALPDDASFGRQLQESLVTLATQAGLTVVEFKTTDSIELKQNRDIMLSRMIEQLDKNIDVKYFLTGTYSQQETQYVVNLRLIDVSSKQILAAATDYVPANVGWHSGNVMLQNQKLYRKAY
ncbi:FlgO family outer membrane protein [Neptunicella sp. SCSIO 80796]|uniref:FlgO family outer membrane protein n=1 Tax=Neptunicella plasticusilytica TaxID=3117012 RepID=UPI003A4E0F22